MMVIELAIPGIGTTRSIEELALEAPAAPVEAEVRSRSSRSSERGRFRDYDLRRRVSAHRGDGGVEGRSRKTRELDIQAAASFKADPPVDEGCSVALRRSARAAPEASRDRRVIVHSEVSMKADGARE